MTFLAYAANFTAGLALGAAYMGALWYTVRRLPATRHAPLWLIGTAIARIALLLAGFYWVSGGNWQLLLACLLGFTVARLAIAGRVKAAGSRRAAS